MRPGPTAVNRPRHGFQSTHPRGVRQISLPTITGKASFNPRTHEGCDAISAAYQSCPYSFNPRTHEGCDSFSCQGCFFEKVSIHAPTRGATHCGYAKPHRCEFQSTHPRGVRRITGTYLQNQQKFQSTHPRGVRLNFALKDAICT